MHSNKTLINGFLVGLRSIAKEGSDQGNRFGVK
jgi:hypothetical protein